MPAGARKPGGASIDPMPDLRPNSCGVSSATNLLDGGEERPATYSDEALALRFTGKHAGTLRYVAAWGRWLIRSPPSGASIDMMWHSTSLARFVRQASSRVQRPRSPPPSPARKQWRRSSASPRPIAVTPQPSSSGTLCRGSLTRPEGGRPPHRRRMHPHRADDYLTKITAVAPGGDCPSGSSSSLASPTTMPNCSDYLQRVAGYCLTGITQEHALFFGHGGGANGKGTLLNTLVGVMGDYAAVASMETFTASTTDRHPADLAMLRGARLVPRRRPRKAADGQRHASKPSPVAIQSPHGSCARISSPSCRSSSCSSPATTSQACAMSMRQSAGG